MIFRNVFFIMIHVFIVSKISSNSNINCKEYKNSTIYNMQELHLSSFLPTIFTSSAISLHSSTNLSTSLFLHTIFIIQILANITRIITFTCAITRIPNISLITYTFINQFLTFASIFIIIPTLFIITNTCIQYTFTLTYFMPFYVPCLLKG